MKKLVCLFLSLMCLGSLAGCEKDKDNFYLEIMSVSYTVNGQETSLDSVINIFTENTTSITKEEYDAFPVSHRKNLKP